MRLSATLPFVHRGYWMRVRFWGTRGSIPTPGRNTSKYGGNTSCVELRAEDGTIIVLDCGTGARVLGETLLEEAQSPLRVNLLITHTHWDHIQGFPFFAPIFEPGVELTVYAPAGFQQNLENAMAGQMQYSYFPVKLQDLRSRMRFYTVDEGAFNIGNALVETQYLNHPAPTIGYRVTIGGVSVVYATDHEPFTPTHASLWHPGDAKHVEFLSNADLVIHDAQYTEDEYISKVGWGHSTVTYATDVALEAGARRLALTHHDPQHDDAAIERIEALCKARGAANRSKIEIMAAAEGAELYLPEVAQKRTRRGAQSALGAPSLAGSRVLLGMDDLAQAQQIADMLAADGVTTDVAADEPALVTALSSHPNMVILDAALVTGDVFAVAANLLKDRRNAGLAIVVLTEHLDDAALRRSAALGLTDCLAKPFSPPLVHARVRAWLARRTGQKRPYAPMAAPPPDVQSQPLALPRRGATGTAAQAKKVQVLADAPLFSSLSRQDLRALAEGARFCSYLSGTVVLRQGQQTNGMQVIVSGRVRVYGRGRDQQAGDVLLQELGPGEVFGEMGLIDGLSVSASVLTLTRVRTLLLPAAQVLHELEHSPAVSFRMMQMLAKRLRQADRLLMRDGPDALTGLMNRLALAEAYRREAASSRRRGYSLALLHVDIQGMRNINTLHGHEQGDMAMQAVADALRHACRESDLLARDDDDEFLVLLSDTEADGAKLTIGRFQRRLTEVLDQRALMDLAVTVRAAATDEPPASLEELEARLSPPHALPDRTTALAGAT